VNSALLRDLGVSALKNILHFIIAHFFLNLAVTWAILNNFLGFINRNKFKNSQAKH
jgi:hypothetical protein